MRKTFHCFSPDKWASLAFGTIICLFWGLMMPHHIHYHEQFQLFLFTQEYLEDKLYHPGGIIEYIAEFLTQFYFLAWLGSLVLATVLTVIQRQVQWLLQSLGNNSHHIPLSYLPSFLLWGYLCDENAMLALPLSIIGTLTGIIIYQKTFRKSRLRLLVILLLTPLLYWIAGGSVLLFSIWIALLERRNILLSICTLIIGIVCPIYAQYLVQYPLIRLIAGIDYYRYPTVVKTTMTVTLLSLLLIPWLHKILPPPTSNSRPWLWGESFLVLLTGIGFVFASVDWEREETLKYDYLLRMKQWNRIIHAAEKDNPKSPFSVTCLNLALAMKGELGERMFHFYQNGTEGLLPSFQRHFTTLLPASEVYYQLGMVNTAQRYTFEAMEAIPNYNKSGRAYKRLAETNLINGKYAVATKYLKTLQHTLFYRKWATETLKLINDETKVNNHPEWGRLRLLRFQNDFLFNESDMEKMLITLLNTNKNNKMAFEYLMAWLLLNNDVELFMKYLPLIGQLGYRQVPLSYQEALLFVWTQQHSSFEGLPLKIPEHLKKGITEFATIYTTHKNPQELLQKKYGNTYWYYILYRK